MFFHNLLKLFTISNNSVSDSRCSTFNLYGSTEASYIYLHMRQTRALRPSGHIKQQKRLTRCYTCQSNFIVPASCNASEKSTAKRLRQQMKLAPYRCIQGRFLAKCPSLIIIVYKEPSTRQYSNRKKYTTVKNWIRINTLWQSNPPFSNNMRKNYFEKSNF